MDVQDPIFLDSEKPLDQILDKRGRSAAEPYHFTPLDFVSRQEWIASRMWVYNVNLLKRLRVIHTYPKALPLQHFSSLNFPIIQGPMLFVMQAISLLYSGVFVAAWNFYFPSRVELILWRTCSLGTMIIVAIGGMFEITLLVLQYSKKEQVVENGDVEMISELPLQRSEALKKPPPTRVQVAIEHARNKTPDQDPEYNVPLRSIMITEPLCAMYTVFRFFILVEDFMSFRAMPASTFQSIDWSTYVPHI